MAKRKATPLDTLPPICGGAVVTSVVPWMQSQAGTGFRVNYGFTVEGLGRLTCFLNLIYPRPLEP